MNEGDLRTRLQGRIPKKLMGFVPRGFDIVGSKKKAVAIIEIPVKLKNYEQIISETLMEVHKNVKTVLTKASSRYGIHRVRKLRIILGEKDTEVLHKEDECFFRFDPRKVYFSPREATERKRIAEMVAPSEYILTMFSGVGPFPIIIAKNHPKVNIVAIEINLDAHNYSVQNIALNRVSDQIKLLVGDVRDICPRLEKTFDRLLMPLPKGAADYLDVAIPCLKDGGILHFYHWAHEEDLFTEAKELVNFAAKEKERATEFLNELLVLPYGPRIWKIRIDARILGKI